MKKKVSLGGSVCIDYACEFSRHVDKVIIFRAKSLHTSAKASLYIVVCAYPFRSAPRLAGTIWLTPPAIL